MPWLLLGILVPAVAWASFGDHGVGHKQWTSRFDPYFRKYAKHYFGAGTDWRWFKAQGIAESGLNPKARSPTGAVGIMQILPSTFGDIKKKNPAFGSLREPRWNIAAGIYYDRHLHKRWVQWGAKDRFSFMFASYNAGLGTIGKAWRKARRRHRKLCCWPQVAPFAPRETRRYVERISGLMKKQRRGG